MGSPLPRKFTLNDLRAARTTGAKVPMLTCYDFTTARMMHEAGVPAILVGDSAGNVILGYDTTLPVPLHFMIQIAAAVKRNYRPLRKPILSAIQHVQDSQQHFNPSDP